MMTAEGVTPNVCTAVAAVIPWIAAFTVAVTMAIMSPLTGMRVGFPPGTGLPGTQTHTLLHYPFQG